MEWQSFRAMSTDILMMAEGQPDALEEGFRCARAGMEAAEKRFTRFSADSELSQLNRAAGSWFEASDDLLEVLEQAVRLHQRTQGLFDPAVLPALERAGYNRSIEEVHKKESAGEGYFSYPAAPVQPASWTAQARFTDLRLERPNRRVWMPKDMRIDLGGIAKGWIAEQAAQTLAEYSSACMVDAGGDMLMVGRPQPEGFWRVVVEDPRDPAFGLTELKLGPGAVATSGTNRRHWQQGGRTQHHLIDPRTGQPAETDWISVTVTTQHAVDAEAYAKSILIAGSHGAQKLLDAAPEIEFVAIDHDNKLWGSAHARELLYV